MPFHAYAAPAPRAALEPITYEPAPLGPHDVEIRITHCGICHSDAHLVDNDWGISRYPLVPGHEVAGVVEAAGPLVKHLAPGHRVGVGWQRGSCHDCEWCVSGQENLCASGQPTCVGSHGGFADRIRLDARFAFRLPDGLDAENAAPLLCGGITVYSPFRLYDVRPGMRVGVIGIGGLGHLALQFARAWGCEVTAFTNSADKEPAARALGAHRVVNSREPSALAGERGKHDFLICTAHADLDWAAYLGTLRPNGTLCMVGVPGSAMAIPAFPLIAGQLRVAGSNTGGRPGITEMLEFAARTGVKAATERFAFRDVNDALDRVRQNKARYRVVLAHEPAAGV